MKRLVTITMAVAMTATAATTAVPAEALKPATNHTASAGVAIDELMLAKVLRAIAQVESGGKAVGIHPDGTSHGTHGITTTACRELIRLNKLSEIPDSATLAVPETNERLARLYLTAMYLDNARGGHSWWLAVGWYHGGDRKEREAYAAKVWGCL